MESRPYQYCRTGLPWWPVLRFISCELVEVNLDADGSSCLLVIHYLDMFGAKRDKAPKVHDHVEEVGANLLLEQGRPAPLLGIRRWHDHWRSRRGVQSRPGGNIVLVPGERLWVCEELATSLVLLLCCDPQRATQAGLGDHLEQLT